MRPDLSRGILVVLLPIAGCWSTHGPHDPAGEADAGVAAYDASVDATALRGRFSLITGGRHWGGVRFYGPSGYSGGAAWRCRVDDVDTRCVLIACQPDLARVDDHAGTITVAVTGGGRRSVMPDANGAYGTVEAPWDPGSEVTLTATGDSVPAFELRVAFPESSVVPVPPSGPVSRRGDLRLTWSAMISDLRVELFQATMAGSVEIACVFDGGSGAGVVPVAAVRRLTLADDVRVSMLSVETTSTVVGPWRIDVTAATRSADGDSVMVPLD